MATKPASITTVKQLAATLKITGKKLRRFLRAHKYQRGAESRWELSEKEVKEIQAAFEKNPKAAENKELPKKAAKTAKTPTKATKKPRRTTPPTLANDITAMNPSQPTA